jgi:5-methylcytosine-specific restriction protein A
MTIVKKRRGKVYGGIYQTQEWRETRARQLAKNPYCVYCLLVGKNVRATFADHVKPHRGNAELFFDENNLQSLCTICHNAAKQREDVKGDQIGCDDDGWPRAAEHSWNTGRAVTVLTRRR